MIGQPCSCDTDIKRTVVCRDCDQRLPTCESCFIDAHRNCPTHWAMLWNSEGGYFVRHDISQLAPHRTPGDIYAIQLGRHYGGTCSYPGEAIPFTLVDLNGVHGTRIRFCKCCGAPEKHRQLMQAGFFPGTIARPQTAFTFRLMKHYHIQHLESKISAYDYIGSARRFTDNVFTDLVQDPYATFQRAAQFWGYLTVCKRMGQCHRIDSELPNRPRGNLRLYCPACPEPGFTDLEGSHRLPKALWHLNQSTTTLDGNHHLVKLENTKTSDPMDKSLWDGNAYMPRDSDYKTHLALVSGDGNYSKAEGDCDYLRAVQKQKLHKFKGQEVTGTVNSQCRHVFVLGSADMHGGESHKNSDYTLAMAINMYLGNLQRDENATETASEHPPACVVDRIRSYDLACISSVHLVKRFSDHFPHLVDQIKMIRWAVPAVHVANHKERCQYEFSTAYLEQFGHFFGETCEVIWAEMNQLGPMICQMNAGRRHDTLNDHFGDWNWKKTIKMGLHLSSSIQTAYSLYIEKRDAFCHITVSFGPELVHKWDALSREFQERCAKKDFFSVYRHKTAKVPLQSAILQHLLAEEARRDAVVDSVLPSVAQTPVAFLNEGIAIQDAQYVVSIGDRCSYSYSHRRKCKALIKQDQEQVAAHRTEIENRRNKLTTHIHRWRQSQASFMPRIADKLDQSRAIEVEDEILWLPSDLTVPERTIMKLAGLADQERALREGECFDAISAVRSAVKTLSYSRKDKVDHSHGMKQQTRSLASIAKAEGVRDAHMARYNSAREALISLGYLENGNFDFSILTAKDTYRKNVNAPHQVGDSRCQEAPLFTHVGIRARPSTSHVQNRDPSERDDETGMPAIDGWLIDTSQEGWIWWLKVHKKMSDEEMEAWSEEGDRVQWFRAEVEMLQWQEELERLQAEFLWTIKAYGEMSKVWDHLAAMGFCPGREAYAKKKAAMWMRMGSECEKEMKKSGYQPLQAQESLIGRIEKWRAEEKVKIRELTEGILPCADII
ncbi:hypothetical protein K488DRAFT_61527 [Vararia minispora EC-137]|uniref:Uncharacterized protein n=1 Tax=Vararia minispora EC-137 TaxID=1314806 RepID=A0ACB8Q7J3_9AGAM|nr:hypothetical protein K488DRAFT_61527 [Vararia minispora EC-137]